MCQHVGCAKKPTFGYVGEKCVRCGTHKLDGMIDLSRPKCNVCNERANYNYRGEKKSIYCKQHKLENMIDINKKYCSIADCETSASYNESNDKSKVYCGKHKTDTAVTFGHSLCIYEGCNKRASYGKPRRYCTDHKPVDAKLAYGLCKTDGCGVIATYSFDGKKPICCNTHKQFGMITTKYNCCFDECTTRGSFKCPETKKHYCAIHKPIIAKSNSLCIIDECEISAGYGYPGKKKTHCVNHKLDGMIIKSRCMIEGCNIVGTFKYDSKRYCMQHKPQNAHSSKKRCEFEGCATTASFGLKGTSVNYCAKHKLDGMIAIGFKTCNYKGCVKPPKFGLPDQGTSMCFQHKLPGMILLSVKRCSHYGCSLYSTFKSVDDTIRRCASHKLPDMILISNEAKCVIDGCEQKAKYGPIFRNAIYCKNHKRLIDLNKEKRNPKCQIEKCKEKPIFAASDNYIPSHCHIHKLDGYKNIIERKCGNCKLEYLIPEGSNICNICSEFEKIRERKPKEAKIRTLLQKNNISYEYHDEIIDASCTRKRPDFVIDYNFFKVVIEVDEHQHNYGVYNPKCEIDRMVEIHQVIGMDTIFIRFNPDKYIDNRGKKISSYQSRESKLIEVLMKLKTLDKLPCYLCYIKLFYDQYDGTDVIIHLDYYPNK
ncbi:hypothetical protein F-LCD7_0302 [Faustovirus]|nr:hypothetical protein F-LCD7_0302 [Faustovirus]QJX74073.1 hypothetical protein F-E9_319 [Faustovirus]